MIPKDFLKKHKFSLGLTFCLLGFFLLALFSTAGFNWSNPKESGMSITCDEFSHISAGYYYLKTGRYFFNPEHPPLVKDVAALPLLFLDIKMPEFINSNFKEDLEYPYPKNISFTKKAEIENDQWSWGYAFLFNPGNDPDEMVFFSRLSVIILNAFFLFLLFLILKKVWGGRAALVSLFLICFSQFTLAHGSLVTMDFLSSTLQISAIACFSIFLRKIFRKEKFLKFYFLSVLSLFLSLVAKFSSLTLFLTIIPISLVYFCFASLLAKGKGVRWKYFFWTSLMVLNVLVLVAIYYVFHIFNAQGEEIVKQISYLYPHNLPKEGADLLKELAGGNLLQRGFGEFILGVFMVFERMAKAVQSVYFLGKLYGSEGAGLWYFPVLYFAKLPLPFLVLFVSVFFLALKKIFSLPVRLKEKFKWVLNNPLIFFLVIFIVLYLFFAVSSRLNIGLRHIMPVVFATMLLVAKGVNNYWEKKIRGFEIGKIAKVFFALIFISTLFSFPNFLSFYNFLGGGKDGYQIATDSNHDWGQDLKALRKWVKEKNPKTIYLEVFSKTPTAYYFPEIGRPISLEKGIEIPKGSFVAVSTYRLQNNVFDDDVSPKNKYTSPSYKLVDRVGETILIYEKM